MQEENNMLNGSDAADQVVRYTLEGTEVALKLSGLAAKNVATYLIAVLNDNKKTRGKTRIARMLREGKPMKIFQIPTEQLKAFAKEAKQYGVLFVAMVDKHNPAPDTDVMVFSRDAAKINRILDKLSLAVVDTGAIESEIMESRGEQSPFVPESGNLSEISSPSSNDSAFRPGPGDGGRDRQSVKKALEEIRQEGKKLNIKDGQQLTQSQPHQAPKRKKKSKAKGR
jgi:hypothetical protein